MKKITVFTLLFLCVLTLASCNLDALLNGNKEDNQDNNEDGSKIENAILIEGLEQINIEIGETYDLRYTLSAKKGMTVTSAETPAFELKDNNILLGLSVGEGNVEFKFENKVQLVKVKVHEVGALSNSFTICKERFAGKKLVAFGDSVTYSGTVAGANTYVENIAYKLKMQVPTNYAIGGSTGTYMYPGSNIAKEYANGVGYIDGVSVVKNLYDEGALAEVDYAIIAFGHNDQYFQPPVTVEGDDVYDVNSFASCNSVKGSYRHMINTLKLANPNVRIIILGCTYSEYHLSNPSRYGNKYNYNDYRQAMKEVAEEFNLTYIDPWDYLSPYFDCFGNKYYYKDSVHLSVQGHSLLADFICNYKK